VVGAGPELGQRRLQLLKEALPAASRVAYIFTADANAGRLYEEARRSAAGLGIDLLPVQMSVREDIAGRLAVAARTRPDAVVIAGSGGTLQSEASLIHEFLEENRLPAMVAANRVWVDRGALMYYDQNVEDALEKASGYVDQILKGANPADLPVARATKFDFIVNVKAAKALGVTLPASILAQATELIE
jgi:putative ABC transport system substrate-binding protein